MPKWEEGITPCSSKLLAYSVQGCQDLHERCRVLRCLSGKRASHQPLLHSAEDAVSSGVNSISEEPD